ncbi:MAG TPA: hypothetical protein VM491_08840, partial [Burkholderiaceae bacterium]|nr:hypothetical protein [Burkholderiaceae bacterium]
QQTNVKHAYLKREPIVYQRMWVKFDVNTLARAQAVGAPDFFQIFWEIKADPDYRIRLQLEYREGHGLLWQAQGDVLKNARPLWQARLTKVPVVLAPHSSAEGWHKVEVWIDRPGGRFRAAIDGVDLVDRRGPLMGASGNTMSQFMYMVQYSPTSPVSVVTETLFDDLELWDAPPPDAWRR